MSTRYLILEWSGNVTPVARSGHGFQVGIWNKWMLCSFVQATTRRIQTKLSWLLFIYLFFFITSQKQATNHRTSDPSNKSKGWNRTEAWACSSNSPSPSRSRINGIRALRGSKNVAVGTCDPQSHTVGPTEASLDSILSATSSRVNIDIGEFLIHLHFSQIKVHSNK
jgi:hypothetical protein